MSIRAEDAAREASRFSLRTTFLGGAPPTATVAQPPPVRRVGPPSTAAAGVFPLPHSTAGSFQGPQKPQGAHASALTFGSITGRTPPTSHAASANGALSPHAADVMRRLAEAQNQHFHQQQQHPQQLTQSASSAATVSGAHTRAPLGQQRNDRILQSGYINGGSMRADATAEIMRLTGLADSLNSKLAMQSERLAKTESSLVRANRSMTSERATYNGRMLRMQTELKDLKASESKMKEKLSSEASFQTSKAATFEESVKKAEEIETKIENYQGAVAQLTARLAAASTLATDAQSKALALESERDGLSARLAACTGAFEERGAYEAKIAQLTDELSGVTRAHAESTGAASAATARVEALSAEWEAEKAATATLVSSHGEALATARAAHEAERAEKAQLLERIVTLTASNEELAARLPDASAVAAAGMNTGCGTYAEPSGVLEAEEIAAIRECAAREFEGEDIEGDAAALAASAATTDGRIRALALEALSEGNKLDAVAMYALIARRDVLDAAIAAVPAVSALAERGPAVADDVGEELRPPPRHAPYGSSVRVPAPERRGEAPRFLFNGGRDACPRDTRHAKTSAHLGGFRSNIHKMVSQRERRAPAIAAAIPPWAATAHAVVFESSAATTAAQNEMQERVQRLVKAVSSDITNACVQKRRDYLAAVGKSTIEIEEEIGALTSSEDVA